MPHTQVLFRSAAREKVPRGATVLCDAVRVTLGPKSKSVPLHPDEGVLSTVARASPLLMSQSPA